MISVEFPRKVEGEGKNGFVQMQGIEIHVGTTEADPSAGNVLKLWAINSKGKLSACKLEIPVESVVPFVEALLSQVGKELQPNSIQSVIMTRMAEVEQKAKQFHPDLCIMETEGEWELFCTGSRDHVEPYTVMIRKNLREIEEAIPSLLFEDGMVHAP